MELEQQIGSRLKASRTYASITVEHATAAASLELVDYVAVEAGEGRATAWELTRLCELLNIRMVDLFTV